MNKRKARAKARAVAQKEILRWHQNFLGKGTRVSRPEVIGGVAFYQVGQNASHSFYAGVDADGQKFRRAFGEGEWDDDGNVIGWTDRISPVESFASHYMGHY